MARLVVDSGPDEGMIFPLTESVTTLGRSPSNTVQVTDRRASRFHAEIIRRGSVYHLRDLASKNGVIIQGVRVTDEYTLKHGDQIRLGQTQFVFEGEEHDSTAPGRTGASGIRLADQTPAMTRSSLPAGMARQIEPTAAEPTQLADGRTTHRRLETLLKVLEKVRSILQVDQLLSEIMDLIFEVLNPERGLIMLIDPKSGALVPRALKSTDDSEEIAISRTMVHQAIRERMALLIGDAADPRFQATDSVVRQRIRTAICAPLTAQDKVLGVVYIDSRNFKDEYTENDLALLTSIADQAALAISNALLHETLVQQNRLERELEIARTIQMNLLPKQPPIVSGFDIAAMSLPAKRVGGDYYDFIQIDSDHLGIAVADVSGKGVPAAIFTASVRSALQVEARREPRLETIFSSLNGMACRDAADNMFVALFFGVLQLSSRRFRFVNAGHCFPFILDAEGRETRLETGGCVLGVMPGRRYEQGEVRLTPNSTMIIYSDGVTDILNERSEAFGIERLRALIAEGMGLSAEVLRQRIFETTKRHMGSADQFDDYTLVIIKAL